MIDPREVIWHAGGFVFTKYGTLTRRTSQVEDEAETFMRPTTVTYDDRDGQSQNAGPDVMVVEWRDWTGDGVPETPVVVVHSNARLWAPYRFQPQERTGYLQFVEPGSATNVGDTLLYIGAGDETGARMYIESDGSGYEIRSVNAASSAVVGGRPADSPVPQPGNIVELLWVHAADGTVRIDVALNGKIWRGLPSVAQSLDPAWGGDRRYIGAAGDAGPGQGLSFVADKEARGLHDFDVMRWAP